MKNWVMAISALLLWHAPLGAETVIGNGGDAVVCKNNDGTISSVELLDYYEARTIHGFQPALQGADFKAKVAWAIARIQPTADWRARTYGSWLADLDKEWRFIPDANLVDIPDSAHTVVPKNCEIRQLAIQRPPRDGSTLRYTVDQDLWDRMDDMNKAGLILHEFIYREAIYEAHRNSVATRYFNAIVSSDAIVQYNWKTIVELLKSLPFSIYSLQGFTGHVDDLKIGDKEVTFVIDRDSIYTASWGEIKATGGDLVFELVNGQPVLKTLTGPFTGHATLLGQDHLVTGDELVMHDANRIKKVTPAEPIETKLQGKDVLLRASVPITLFEDGKLQLASLAEPRYLRMVDGTYATFYGSIEIDAQGLIVKGKTLKKRSKQ